MSVISLLLGFQTVSKGDFAAVDRLRAAGADVRVEKSEVWVDFKKPLTDSTLAMVNGVHALTALRVLAEGTTDAGMENIRDVPRLWLFVVKSKKLTDRGCEAISKLQSLKKLDLIGPTLSAKGIRCLAKLRHLEQLYLYGANVRDSELKALASLPHLKTLVLPRTAPDSILSFLRRRLPKTNVERI